MLTRSRFFAVLCLVAAVVGCDAAEVPAVDGPGRASGGRESASQFVFAKIQDTVKPIDRGEKYEDPLDEALKAAGLGEVTGGGSSLEQDGSIAWVGVDIELTDQGRGIPFLKQKLIELGAPRGSVLEYSQNGQMVETAVHN